MQRQNDIWLRGDRILRFPAHLLRAQPIVVVRTIRAALAAAGWTSTRGRQPAVVDPGD